MPLSTVIALVLAAAGSGSLEASRARQQQADQARLAVEAQLGQEQGQLDTVSKHIEALKSQREQSSTLFVPGNLDGLLKQSQSLSESLTALRTQQAQLQAEEDAARADLSRSLESKVEADRAALPTAADKPALVAELRALEAERAALSAPVKDAAGPAPRFAGHSDDPRELRERADALRDRADKLTKEQARVEARIQELRDQAELDRQLGSLSRQDALFDEADLRVQASRTIPSEALKPSSPSANGGATNAAVPAQSTGPHASPLYTGGQLSLPANPARSLTGQTDTNDAPSSGAAFSQGTPPPSVVGIDPATRDNGPQSEIPETLGSTSWPSQTVGGELVRPSDLTTQGGAVAPAIDEDSVASLLAAKARLEAQLRQLHQQAAALDAQAKQAR